MLGERNKRIHEVCYFLGALAHGAELNLGSGTLSVCFLAGKKFGREAVAHSRQSRDPFEAVSLLSDALQKRRIWWEFEPFEGDSGRIFEEDDKQKIRLVFHTCMVRNTLFRYAHEQKKSLCYMSHGVFAGAMENIMPDCSVHLEIVHAGPNACLKDMIWEAKR